MIDEGKIDATVYRPKLPETLHIGEFTLEGAVYSDRGTYSIPDKQFSGVSGTAWLSFAYNEFPDLKVQFTAPQNYIRLEHCVEVVGRVVNPQTEISLETAHRIKPGITIGETLRVEASLHPAEFQELVQNKTGLGDWLKLHPSKGQVLVGFDNVTIKGIPLSKTGTIIQGVAVYPTTPQVPQQLQISLFGFTLTLHNLTLTTEGTKADITLKLPSGLAEVDSCAPATLKLGEVQMTPYWFLQLSAPEAKFGPWMVGDTGLVITGTGYSLNLRPMSHPNIPLGLILHSGQASGAQLVPEPANTGYLRGQFGFSRAEVTKDGLDARLILRQPHAYKALNPLGYEIRFDDGWLLVIDSLLRDGEFGPGEIELPLTAVCFKNIPGNPVVIAFDRLTMGKNLDLVGTTDCSQGLGLSWGELTHPGSEVVTWAVEAQWGYLYLPATPLNSFYPVHDKVGEFYDPSCPWGHDAKLTELASHGVSGLTLSYLTQLTIFTPDRVGGTQNPITLPGYEKTTYLRIASQGVDGYFWLGCNGLNDRILAGPYGTEELGNPARPGYVGDTCFKPSPKENSWEYRVFFVNSAVYDSSISGFFEIPGPCDIPELPFSDMELTSTANLVGGKISLLGGVDLAYWQLQLVGTSNEPAGVLSVRTGRIIFTHAGIREKQHFTQDFRLTWGEMLADGNLRELFFDYNNYGQCFDQISYTPHNIRLSLYVPNATDAYLATCGTVHFNFFGPKFVNIRDARYDEGDYPPFNKRKVTVPKLDEDEGCQRTNLHLTGTVHDSTGADLAVFDFPDAQMDYDEKAQNGFIGWGTGSLSFIHSNGLNGFLEIHHGAIDIRLESGAEETHDLMLGSGLLGGLTQIVGCARIKGPCLSRISLSGFLERSPTGMGVLAPQAALAVEVNLTTTPNCLDFNASGDLLLSVAKAAVHISGAVHLHQDYSDSSASGQVVGRINCGSILAGLGGEGQLTWYVDPDMQHVQGAIGMHLSSFISHRMEGGLFIGHQVPREVAWAVHPGGHFGVSDAILPDYLTGVFGYGKFSDCIDLVLISGGIELFAGMGVFSDNPFGLPGVWDDLVLAALGLPYVIGSCGVYLHGEILKGFASASGWATLNLQGPIPIYYKGSVKLRGCAFWKVCKSVSFTARFDQNGFHKE